MNATRTTVTLDPDVAEQLKTIARRRNEPFEVALDNAVRAGIAAEQGAAKPYKVPTWPMRVRPGVDLTHALQMAGDLEDEEIIRKHKLGT